MTKKALLLIISAIMLVGCGYKIVLTGKDAAFTIYPSQVLNYSNDLNATSQFRDAVKLYLTSINALGQKDKSDYIGEFKLQKVDSTGSSSSSVTTTAHVRTEMSVTIYKNDEKIFDRKFISSENYDNTNSQSETRANKDQAINKAIEKAMMDFRNAFEQK